MYKFADILSALLAIAAGASSDGDWNLRGAAGSEPHTDDTIHQAAIDWCTGGDARTAVIAKHGAMKDWDVAQVTDMKDLFRGYGADGNGGGNDFFNKCTLYVEDWDTSSVTTMESMFANAEAFNGDVSSWDTSSVSTMVLMFWGAEAFNGDLSKWDTSSVTTMENMFWGASAFNGGVSTWDTSSVTTMRRMFADASAFNGDVSKWEVYLVSNFSNMFEGASAFNGEIRGWDVSNAKFSAWNFVKFLCRADKFENHLCESGSSASWVAAGYCVDGAPPSDPCAE
jgi:surface protein